MQISMTDKDIVFLVDCSPEPYGENGEPIYANFYPIFGGWREFAYWRLSRIAPRPSKEYAELDHLTYLPEEGFPEYSGSYLSGYSEFIEQPSNYDTPHP